VGVNGWLAAGGLSLLLIIGLVWARFARNELPFLTLFRAILYMIAEIPLYLAFIVRPRTQSTRTERE
jgi:hypothetical protein